MMLNKAAELLKNTMFVSLASINEAGYPRTCIVTKLQSEGVSKIYVATGTSSKKTQHFKANPKASICYYNEQDSVILLGNVNIVECAELKRSMWQDWLLAHLPDGPDGAEYCLLEFVSNQATIYIDGGFETVAVDNK